MISSSSESSEPNIEFAIQDESAGLIDSVGFFEKGIEDLGGVEVLQQKLKDGSVVGQFTNEVEKISYICRSILLVLSKPTTVWVNGVSKLLEQPQLPYLQDIGVAPYVLGAVTIMALVKAIKPVAEFIESQRTQ